MKQTIVTMVSGVTIEQGVPLPYIRGTYHHIWDAMREGESFVCPTEQHRNAALMAGRRAKCKVVSEKLNGQGFRLWLVKRNK